MWQLRTRSHAEPVTSSTPTEILQAIDWKKFQEYFVSIISQLPRWAQGPTQKFIDQAKIEGTQQSPMDQDSFQQSFNQAAGGVQLASLDEVPGEDQALGQPGLVERNGATIYCQGDPSLSRGQVEVAVIGHRQGREYVTYVHSRPDGFSTLRMVNDQGSVELQASQAQRKAGGLQGYLLAGEFSTDPPA